MGAAPLTDKPSRARAILLDLDKTLVNVEDHTDYCAAVAEVRTRLPHLRPELCGLAASFSPCALEALRLLHAASRDRATWDLVNAVVGTYELAGAERSTPMPGLRGFLAAVGGRKTAVVTLLAPQAAFRCLERHGIPADVVVAREFGLRMKPHPQQVREALRRLGVRASEALMLGDSEWDQLAASAAGVAFVGITWGRTSHAFRTPTVENLRQAADLLRDY